MRVCIQSKCLVNEGKEQKTLIRPYEKTNFSVNLHKTHNYKIK